MVQINSVFDSKNTKGMYNRCVTLLGWNSWFCHETLQKVEGEGGYKLDCHVTVIRKIINKII